MATRKKTKAKAAKKAVIKAKAVKKAPAKPKAASRTKSPARHQPETLRLKTFLPSYTVADLQKSIAFYTKGLGFVEGDRWNGDDGVLRGIMLKAGALELGLSQDDWKMGKDRVKGVGLRIYFETQQNIDAIAARAKAAGYTLTTDVEDNPGWGVRSFSLDDPDGFHISFTRKL